MFWVRVNSFLVNSFRAMFKVADCSKKRNNYRCTITFTYMQFPFLSPYFCHVAIFIWAHDFIVSLTLSKSTHNKSSWAMCSISYVYTKCLCHDILHCFRAIGHSKLLGWHPTIVTMAVGHDNSCSPARHAEVPRTQRRHNPWRRHGCVCNTSAAR